MLKTVSGVLPICVLLLASTACGILTSKPIKLEAKKSPIPTPAGYYFLPLMKVVIEAERKSPDITKTVTNEGIVKTETTGQTDAKPTTKKPNTDSTTTQKTSSEKDENGTYCTLALKETRTEADRKYFYSLEHIRNAYAEDKINVTMTTTGLLTKVDVSAEDKVPEFFAKLGELAKESAKAAAALAMGLKTEQREKIKPFHYIFILDPTESGELKAVNDALAKVDCNLEVKIEPEKAGNIPPSVEDYIDPAFVVDPDCTSTPACKNDGRNAIFFRPALPYILSFKTKNEAVAPEIVLLQHPINLPNKAPIMALDLQRVRFGKYESTLSFTEGMLTEVKFTVPSSALGFMKIPIEIAKTIASIPGEIIQLKIDISQKEKNLVTEQAAVIEAQKTLLERQEELRQYIEELRNKKDKEGTTDSYTK